MPYDPNDPNQDSQRPDEVFDPNTGTTTNQATAQMNDFGAYMRSHPGWKPSPAQLAAINAQLKDGTIKPNDPSYLPLYLMAAAMAAPAAYGAIAPAATATTASGAGAGIGSTAAGLSGLGTGASSIVPAVTGAAAGGGAGATIAAMTPLTTPSASSALTGLSAGIPSTAPVTEAASSPLLDLGLDLPSSQIGTGAVGPITGSTPSMAFDAPGSTISKVLGSLSKAAPNLSSSLGSLQQGIQNNRLQTGSMAAQYDNALQAAQTGRNQTESDALKKLAQTSYILSGGFKPNPNQTMQLNGQTRDIQNYGMAPLPSSDAQKAGAQSLQDQLGARLKPGGTATPLPFSDYGTPGTGEKLASAGAGITSMLPTVKSIYDMFTK